MVFLPTYFTKKNSVTSLVIIILCMVLKTRVGIKYNDRYCFCLKTFVSSFVMREIYNLMEVTRV